jgi:hypothetical protein
MNAIAWVINKIRFPVIIRPRLSLTHPKILPPRPIRRKAKTFACPVKKLMLCRERLNRIHAILGRRPDGVTVREFARKFSVWGGIEQAAELGFVKIETRKPRTGRSGHRIKGSLLR